MKSLFDQLSESGLGAVSCLVGSRADETRFLHILKSIEPLPEPFKIGDAVIAYGKYLQVRYTNLAEID